MGGTPPRGSNKVEFFSPVGTCQFQLAPLSNIQIILSPSLAYNDGKVVAYPSSTDHTKFCWSYSIVENTWTNITSIPHDHGWSLVTIALNKKMYIIDDTNPEVMTNSWTRMPRSTIPIGQLPCLVTWKDTILVLGLNGNSGFAVQSFNTTSNMWSVLDKKSAPFKMYQSSCIRLPTDEVLVVANYDQRTPSALYNIR